MFVIADPLTGTVAQKKIVLLHKKYSAQEKINYLYYICNFVAWLLHEPLLYIRTIRKKRSFKDTVYPYQLSIIP